MFAVRMARRSKEVCTTSGARPASTSNSPPRRASASPVAVRSTSTHPVNRFFLFQSLSPWRSRIRVGTRSFCRVGDGALGEVPERLQVGQRLVVLHPPGPLAADGRAEAEFE